MQRDLTFAYVSLLRILILGCLFAAYWAGWLLPLFLDDNTYVIYLIAVMYLIGSTSTWILSWKLSHWTSTPIATLHGVDKNQLMKERFEHLLALPTWFQNEIAMVGLIGTFVGIIIAASHLDVTALNNLSTAVPALGGLMQEAIASFGKSMAGAVFALCLTADLFLLNRRTFELRNQEVVA